ncbi:vq motif-containing protein 11 [Abeliophyllum distichum]|uniref:Vq motif-containing protein 11 n=1 Tax=Abeliophyllum distichum TaxID=126358 RepID=A0ABD1V9Z8_9LAMI
MASSSSYNPNAPKNPNSDVQFVAFPNGFDPNSIPNTTFVQADPSTFRAVVQKLTGTTTPDSPTHNIPAATPSRLAGKPISAEMGPRKPAFKLHERRQSARKLEIQLGGIGSGGGTSTSMVSPSTARYQQRNLLGFNGEMVMVSPVSPLEYLARGSPRTPRSPMEEEDRAIAEKRFYLHPSPLSTPRGAEPPELLPLFPVQSPRQNNSFSPF